LTINDAYIELGLAPGAPDAEVKAAWRRLVSRWHPDRNASAEAAALIQRINGAYERIRMAVVSVDAAGSSEAAQAEPAADGRTVQRRVRLSIEEAVLGSTRVLRGRLQRACAACDGSGARGAPLRCATCGGSGQRRGDWWVAWPPVAAPCGDCDGTGTRRTDCPVCEGAGAQTQRYRCTVRLPAGLRHGDQLGADGGGSHRGGFDGRLDLRIELVPHPFFQVGDDGLLRGEFPVDGFAWLAQRWVEIPAPAGLQQMRLRRGRLVYRLPGLGLPLQRGAGPCGDYLVTVVPAFPDQPDAEQQALLDRLAVIADAQPAPVLRDWRQRLQAWAGGRGASG
jgi:molecular chaperone DnaJ